MNAQSMTAPATATNRKTAWLAWTAWTLTVAIIIAGEVFGYLNDPSVSLGGVSYTLVLLAFATVGALISSRRHENRIGWFLMAGTFLLTLGGLALEYAVYTLLTAPHTLPGGELMLWFGAWVRSLGFFTLIIFVPLLFPNGRLPSPRWRRVAWIAVGALALITFLTIFDPVNEAELRLPPLPNPLGITIPLDIYGPLSGISFLGIGVVTLVVAASVIVRFRRAEGEERQQLKWFAYAGILAAVLFSVILIGQFLLPPAVLLQFGGTLFTLALAGFPIAVGIAILKYRLYEIDILINRTLVYIPLTAILAGIFAASITLTQKFFVALTGQSSDAATVLTTLIVVSVFTPIKERLEKLVEKRFKEAPDPTKRLKTLNSQLRDYLQMADASDLTRHALDEALTAFEATGAALYLNRDGQGHLAYAAGNWNGEAKMSVLFARDGTHSGRIELGARKNGADYGDADRALLQETADLIVHALKLSTQTEGAN